MTAFLQDPNSVIGTVTDHHCHEVVKKHGVCRDSGTVDIKPV